ncbi:hypothetical protein MMC13_004798 [Lambiella insularis]|nr:hypothetical protein [Lambiella insularis]
MATLRPENESVKSLLQSVERKFPEAWREDRWYLTAIAALIGSGKPSLVGHLYIYLIEQHTYATPTQRQHLIRRMREAMIKVIILCGIPIVLKALASVAELEREEDKDYHFSREGWQADEANKKRGVDVLDFLYQEDQPKIMAKYAAHRDLRFISDEISYGLFLSDHQILDLAESELVILPAIMCQNLKGPTLWHLRGCVRAGISLADTELIQQAIELIATFAGKTLDVGRVGDIKDEMHNLL